MCAHAPLRIRDRYGTPNVPYICGDVARRPEEGRHTTRRVPKRTGMQCTSSRTRGEPEYPTAAGAAGAAGAAWFAACWVLGSTALLSVSRGRGARSGSTLLRAVRLREMRCRAPHWSATRRRAAGRGCVSFAVSGVLTVGVPSRVPAFFPRLSPLGASSFRASADASIAYTAGDRASVSARARGPGGQVPPEADAESRATATHERAARHGSAGPGRTRPTRRAQGWCTTGTGAAIGHTTRAHARTSAGDAGYASTTTDTILELRR